jgi:hypothetical protein
MDEHKHAVVDALLPAASFTVALVGQFSVYDALIRAIFNFLCVYFDVICENRLGEVYI